MKRCSSRSGDRTSGGALVLFTRVCPLPVLFEERIVILLYSYVTVSTELTCAQLRLHISAPEMLINIHEGSVCELWCVCSQTH